MGHYTISRVLVISFIASMCFAHNISAGEIKAGFSSCRIDGSFSKCEWAPNRCYKPSKPFFLISVHSSKTEINFAISEYNSYVQSMKSYVSCIASEADADIEKISLSIKDDAVKAVDEAQHDVSSVKSDLELWLR